MKSISIVVPVYFNSATLPTLVSRVEAALKGRFKPDEIEIVLVDDGSGDDSFKVIRELTAKHPSVVGVRLSRNFGSNCAILAGLTYATGRAACVLSADLQDPPEFIPELISAWEAGSQVVVAARKSRKDPFLSKLVANFTNRLFRRFVFKDYPPQGFDFMLIDRAVIDILTKLMEKNSYIFGQALWVGFRRSVIYYDREEREHGRSRWTLAKKCKYFVDIFTAFSYLPLRASSLLGFLLAASGFLYAAFIAVLRWQGGVPVPGWSALTIIVLLASGFQLIILGILGEYVWRTLDEVRRRPPFIVAENTRSTSEDVANRP